MLLLLFLLILLLAVAWGLADYQLNARIDSATPPAPPAVVRSGQATLAPNPPVITPRDGEGSTGDQAGSDATGTTESADPAPDAEGRAR
ncbi:hypothetical protein [Rhodocyclus tenuis]|uniref:Uncharacterized protein n=1 Tax=Rhodocyclus tenuis TaxID=1066 RepID=A0A840FXT3_RHOTE|nr:hypothetical protein [Rhodocyclus tenuis]MBB4246614.1 hypothetical protein [Rhodocyclus tenuis]MBK1681802.1 hypothetical protein [Rhodocyclus tenuis]